MQVTICQKYLHSSVVNLVILIHLRFCHKLTIAAIMNWRPFTLPATLPVTRIFSHYPTRTLPEVKKPYPSQPAPTPPNSFSNCVKDEYGEKAEEVKSQGKASKPHASPLISTNSLSNCVKDVLVAFDQSFERYCFYQTIFSQTEIEFGHL